MTVLLVSSSVDPHVPRVGAELERRGADWAFLEMNHLGRLGLTLRCDRRGLVEGAVRARGREIPLADIESVWAPSPLPLAQRRGLSPVARAIIESEWTSSLQNLYFLTSDRRWVNPLDAEMEASSKVRQLQLAREVGFEVPATLVTTRGRELAAFAARFPDGVANKRVGDLRALMALPYRVRRRGFFTRRLYPPDFTPEVLRQARHCPSQLQEYVTKATEWRVYVVGDRVFGAEILSQREAQTATDWRRYPVRFGKNGEPQLDTRRWRCRRIAVPREFAQRCRRLARRLRLAYTGMDFVRTPDGRLVFLEANFGAIYAWIEDLTGMPLSKAVADLLLEPRRSVGRRR